MSESPISEKSAEVRRLLDLTPKEFFSTERLIACGADTKSLPARIQNTLNWQAHLWQISTMADFMEDFGSGDECYLQVPNMGKKSIAIVMKALEALR